MASRRNDFWLDRTFEKLGADVGRAKEAMANVIGRPRGRRPAVAPLIQQAIADPNSVDPTGRAYIYERLKDRYGDLADQILPYLGVDEGIEPGFGGGEEEVY